jgi:phosphoglycolate phosphatase
MRGKKLKLHELLEYKDIVVQCHDNPDADALASGFAVYLYLKQHGRQVSLIYGGRNAIRKSNLVLMVNELGIPIQHVSQLEEPELLVTVDCQYGEGNVSYFKAKNVAVIDHHRAMRELPKMSAVKSRLGSCSTLVWDLLKKERFDVNADPRLATALYYGLYSDTSAFAELSHPLDRDLRDQAAFDPQLVTKFRNANLSIEELEVAGTALLKTDYLDEYRCAIVKVGPCDPNILGIISDLVLEVDAVDVCLVFTVLPTGVKLSVRSCVKEVQANEFAAEITKGIGTGGGHIAKGGGSIYMNLLLPEYEEYCRNLGVSPRMVLSDDGVRRRPSDSAIKSFLERRIAHYFETAMVIYAGDERLRHIKLQEYIRKPRPFGYVKATELFAAGTAITLRTMEGDIDTIIEPDTIFLIGIKGEVTLTKEASFQVYYRPYDWLYTLKEAEYKPTVRDNTNRKTVSLMEFAKVCIPTGKNPVRAKKLEHNVKIFSEWDKSKYMKGRIGDYLVIRNNNLSDVFTMDGALFEEYFRNVGEIKECRTQAVIFDLDGTLLDTLQDLCDAVNYALRRSGMPERTIDEVRQFVGNGVEKLMIRAVPEGKENPAFDETFAHFRTYYGEHCKDHTGPYPDILLLMKELDARGIRMAIVSNKLDSAVKELDKEYFTGLTRAAIGEMEGVSRKPAPDTALKAMKELGVTAEHAIYVGDSDVDIQTAANAGIPCVSVTWGFRSEEFLREHGAKQLIHRPLELLALL